MKTAYYNVFRLYFNFRPSIFNLEKPILTVKKIGSFSKWASLVECIEDWCSAEYDFNKKLTRPRPKRSERNLQIGSIVKKSVF